MNISFIKKIKYILSPSSCAYCGDTIDDQGVLCGLCQNRIEPVAPLVRSITSTQDLTICAAGVYQEPLKSLILAKRHGNRVASKQLGDVLWGHTPIQNLPCDVLVPIPLHWSRYASRGYNQAEVMARQLATHNGAVVAPSLSRVRRTAYQAGLQLHARQSNVQAAFALNNDYSYKDKHIILVDDLITTGATLMEAARVMLYANPASITAVVACRVA